jgi:ArsR family transcriptional regulator, arsenate/arsenite/antimonite-responsive transcriptional repressor
MVPQPHALIPLADLEPVAARFRLLGEPTRLQILNLLHAQGEQSVQAISEATEQSQANVSKHLRLLYEGGLVSRRQQGHYVYYGIADPTLAAICTLVCSRIS